MAEQEEGAVCDGSGPPGEEVPNFRPCPIPYLTSAHDLTISQEYGMKISVDQTPMIQALDLLEEAVQRTGFSRTDIEELIDSELKTSHLLEYITAVMADRMN